jgi:hypothetical protein
MSWRKVKDRAKEWGSSNVQPTVVHQLALKSDGGAKTEQSGNNTNVFILGLSVGALKKDFDTPSDASLFCSASWRNK